VELADEAEIHVCTVFPYAIDTPHFEVAANRVHKKPYAMPPAQSPEKVARAIARLVERPRRTLFVPRLAVLGLAFHAIMPRASERLLLDALRKWHLAGTEEVTEGNLFASTRDVATTHGTRPPRVSTLRFFAWAALRFVGNELAALVRLTRRAGGTRLESRRHRELPHAA
jgi:hypothetical protein